MKPPSSLLPGSSREAAVRRVLNEAIRLHGAGNLDQARKLVEADKAALRTSVGQNIVGDILMKQGKLPDALKAFDAAIKLAPSAPEAYVNRGVVLEALGKPADALAAHDRALKARPQYATAHFNRGNVLGTLGRTEEALAAYDQALRNDPRLAEARLNRGLALVSLGRPREALDDMARALTLRPGYAAAYVGQAAAHRALGAYDAALASLDAAAKIEPDNVDAGITRAEVLIAGERYADALAVADDVVARHPQAARPHTTRASALAKLQRYDEAIAATGAAIARDPTAPSGYTVRSLILSDLGRHDEAVAAVEQAAAHGASGGEYLHARAMALTAAGDFAEADAAYRGAMAIQPHSTTLHTNYGFFLLSHGAWADGWREHETRLTQRSHPASRYATWAPQWRGEDISGKRLFLYGEQGYGDTIQFVRYVRLLSDRGAEIRLAVGEPLRRLFADNFPEVIVSDPPKVRVEADYQASLMSLPFAFGTTVETVPQNVPYLRADPERIAKWRARLGDNGLKIGIAWQGNPKYSRDRFRSIAIREFAPLSSIPGARLISLQVGDGVRQLDDLAAGMAVETLGDEVAANPDGFREIAAVMANLDVLVMSDTGPTHLAGALGRPVYLALAKQPDWRWMRSGETTPWYPTMRLLRQQTTGDWASVFQKIAAEIAARE